MNNGVTLNTGVAGFIGYHLCQKLLQNGENIIGLDNLNSYYDIELKRARLNELGIVKSQDLTYNTLIDSVKEQHFQFINLDISDRENLPLLFQSKKINRVVNLAAQAGVRYSIEAPFSYVDSNLVGFLNILECCRNFNIQKLVYASSSSVYGDDNNLPFNEQSKEIKQKSFYAVTKRANELMAQCYSDLYGLKAIGLRFFTVYGPWGRPDMAPILFANAILNDQEIKVFNNGNLSRDFTYIDDIINGIVATLSAQTKTNHTLLNIGCGSPTKLLDFISVLEEALGKKAQKKLVPMQKGDVYKTWTDISQLKSLTGYIPQVKLKEGIGKFIKWYLTYTTSNKVNKI
jgi:UDP-glucuronate 4-epimerase